MRLGDDFILMGYPVLSDALGRPVTTYEDRLYSTGQVRLAFPNHKLSPQNASGRTWCETRQACSRLDQWKRPAHYVCLIQTGAGVRRICWTIHCLNIRMTLLCPDWM